MTSQKSFKSRVRARMSKTGERYAAARRQLLNHPGQSEPDASPTPVRRATRRMSDETVRSRTGRGWDEWFALLDAWDAPSHTHTRSLAGWSASTTWTPGGRRA